jgi:hypothetical protein
MWSISGELPYQDIRDAIGADGPAIRLAGSAPGPRSITGVGDLGPLVLAHWLDIPFQFMTVAATGTAQQELMFERGDTNSIAASSIWYQWPSRKPGWTEEGIVRPFVGMAPTGVHVEDNRTTEWTAPMAWELSEFLTEAQIEIWDGITAAETFVGKNLYGPPGMDRDVRDSIYQGIQNLLAEPGMLEEWERILGEPHTDFPGPDGLTELWEQYHQGFVDSQQHLQSLQDEVFERFVN